MKKLTLAFILLTSLSAIQVNAQKSSESSSSSNIPTGSNFEKTANTELVLKTIKAMEAMDAETYKSYFAPNAIFHDNLDSMSLDQNVGLINLFKSKGITVKLEKVAPIWEYVYEKKSSKTEISNFVISYQYLNFTKGDKNVRVLISGVDLVKNGKITEEWLSYDTRSLYELLK